MRKDVAGEAELRLAYIEAVGLADSLSSAEDHFGEPLPDLLKNQLDRLKQMWEILNDTAKSKEWVVPFAWNPPAWLEE